MDQGIAGFVATSGQVLNIRDAYENPNFNQAIDKKTGYRTRAILCMPIKANDQTIGVLQLINKTSGSGVFTTEDEDVMNIFLSIAGPILAESKLYQQIQGKNKAKDKEKETGTGMIGKNSSERGGKMMPGFAEADENEEEVA
jgi:signal transduction protein with GAF and PtsI domain